MIRAGLSILALSLAIALSPSAHSQITMGSPSWSQLSPQERQVLAPLQSDWDRLEPQRKLKWRGIAQRYPNMGVEEQQRIQQQMKSWAELTPAQAGRARAIQEHAPAPPGKERRGPAEMAGIPEPAARPEARARVARTSSCGTGTSRANHVAADDAAAGRFGHQARPPLT